MAITFGSGSAPSQITLNFDALFGQSLPAYRKQLIDNIGAANPFLYEMIKRDYYESQEGGAYIQTPLMYALAQADSYDGYDELSSAPTDGVTDAIFQWRQCASPVTYSMKEVKQNKQRIVNLVKTKIKQTEMGLQEYFSQSLWGSGFDGGSLVTARTSAVNGSSSIDPIPLLIHFTPSSSVVVGNINQSTSTWWRNKTFTSAATTYDGFYLETDHNFNTCSLGSGGKPKLVLMDQVSYELFLHALWQHYRMVGGTTKVDDAYPFENVMYKGAHFCMDDKVPDIFSGTSPTLVAGAGDSSTLTYGSAYYINPEFFKLIYEEDSDFTMLKDENGKTFQKPVNGDNRLGHVAWMGNLTVNNRRKQGVQGKIARTLVTP